MNSLRKEVEMLRKVFRHFEKVNLRSPSMIVGWQEDAGNLAPKVTDFLNEKLRTRYFCEIKPAEFFSTEGIPVRDDVIQFPESKFYAVEEKDLVIFKSNSPTRNWYKFLNSVLDIAQYYCKIKELYTVNGIPAPIAHTVQRRVLTVANHPKFKKELKKYGLLGMEFEGDPSLSGFLLWVAERRNIPGISLWEDIPFYLRPFDDFRAQKRIIEFFDQKFNLGIDFYDLEERIKDQDKRIDQLRKEDSEINKSLRMLEMGISLSGEERFKLVTKVTELLEKRG